MAAPDHTTVHTAGEADAELLGLVAQYIAAVAEEQRIFDRAADVEEATVKAASDRAESLADEVTKRPALTRAGLHANALAAEAWLDGQADECPIVASLLDDLLRQDRQADAR